MFCPLQRMIPERLSTRFCTKQVESRGISQREIRLPIRAVRRRVDVSLFHGHLEFADDILTPSEVNSMATKYDGAFKAQAVQLVTDLKKPIVEVARDLGIPETTLHQWLKHSREYPERPFVGSGKLRPADQEVHELQRRIRDLEEENAILKKKRCASSPTIRRKIRVHS